MEEPSTNGATQDRNINFIILLLQFSEKMKENTMKVLCPQCNTHGFLEQRGTSSRIKHYMGFIDGKRKYAIHPLTKTEAMGINGNQLVGIKTFKTSSKSENKRGCRLAWSRLLASGARDHGPNPGSPTTRKR